VRTSVPGPALASMAVQSPNLTSSQKLAEANPLVTAAATCPVVPSCPPSLGGNRPRIWGKRWRWPEPVRPGKAVTSTFLNSVGALGGIRTPNLLIRSQMLYPLSYERIVKSL
jgi:hypothetical protein